MPPTASVVYQEPQARLPSGHEECFATKDLRFLNALSPGDALREIAAGAPLQSRQSAQSPLLALEECRALTSH